MLALIGIVGVGREWIRANALRDEIEQLEQEKESVVQRIETLDDLMRYAESPAFVEEQARESFGLAKPGESVAMIPVDSPLTLVPPEQWARWREWWVWATNQREWNVYKDQRLSYEKHPF